ncbi:hypothetical protein J6590_043735 [Homalodisca vitripennis]|nr:hypothetical protein J6590_043735 [Homalodisca vitripennis]
MTDGRDIHEYEIRGTSNYRTGRHRTVVMNAFLHRQVLNSSRPRIERPHAAGKCKCFGSAESVYLSWGNTKVCCKSRSFDKELVVISINTRAAAPGMGTPN